MKSVYRSLSEVVDLLHEADNAYILLINPTEEFAQKVLDITSENNIVLDIITDKEFDSNLDSHVLGKYDLNKYYINKYDYLFRFGNGNMRRDLQHADRVFYTSGNVFDEYLRDIILDKGKILGKEEEVKEKSCLVKLLTFRDLVCRATGRELSDVKWGARCECAKAGEIVEDDTINIKLKIEDKGKRYICMFYKVDTYFSYDMSDFIKYVYLCDDKDIYDCMPDVCNGYSIFKRELKDEDGIADCIEACYYIASGKRLSFNKVIELQDYIYNFIF